MDTVIIIILILVSQIWIVWIGWRSSCWTIWFWHPYWSIEYVFACDKIYYGSREVYDVFCRWLLVQASINKFYNRKIIAEIGCFALLSMRSIAKRVIEDLAIRSKIWLIRYGMFFILLFVLLFIYILFTFTIYFVCNYWTKIIFLSRHVLKSIKLKVVYSFALNQALFFSVSRQILVIQMS
jgi:hypothetical protein